MDGRNELHVARAELVDALKLISKTAARRKGEEAVLSFDGANIHVEFGGACVAVAATGSFNVQVRVGGAMLLLLGRSMPSGDPLRIVVAGGELGIQTLRIPCSIQPCWSKTIDVATNLGKRAAGRILLGVPEADLRSSGLAGMADSIPKDLMRALEVLESYGVGREEVLEIVRRRQTEKWLRRRRRRGA